MSKEHELYLNIKPSPEDDIEELQKLTLQLRQDISELDVEKVDYIRAEEIPPGAKAGDMITWGSLLISIATSAAAGSGGLLPALVTTVQSWLTRRQEKRTISIEIGGDKLEVSAISSEDQKRIIDTWINRQEEKMGRNA